MQLGFVLLFLLMLIPRLPIKSQQPLLFGHIWGASLPMCAYLEFYSLVGANVIHMLPGGEQQVGKNEPLIKRVPRVSV